MSSCIFVATRIGRILVRKMVIKKEIQMHCAWVDKTAFVFEVAIYPVSERRDLKDHMFPSWILHSSIRPADRRNVVRLTSIHLKGTEADIIKTKIYVQRWWPCEKYMLQSVPIGNVEETCSTLENNTFL